LLQKLRENRIPSSKRKVPGGSGERQAIPRGTGADSTSEHLFDLGGVLGHVLEADIAWAKGLPRFLSKPKQDQRYAEFVGGTPVAAYEHHADWIVGVFDRDDVRIVNEGEVPFELANRTADRIRRHHEVVEQRKAADRDCGRRFEQEILQRPRLHCTLKDGKPDGARDLGVRVALEIGSSDAGPGTLSVDLVSEPLHRLHIHA
jgi:hypothetical protein